METRISSFDQLIDVLSAAPVWLVAGVVIAECAFLLGCSLVVFTLAIEERQRMEVSGTYRHEKLASFVLTLKYASIMTRRHFFNATSK